MTGRIGGLGGDGDRNGRRRWQTGAKAVTAEG
jgi:hypothetical protein